MGASDLPAIAVVIVTFNSAEHIAGALRALDDQLAADDELIVVDNDSRDATVATVRAISTRARVLEQRVNAGFAGGCNAGAAAAARAPLLLFLNPDAAPAPGCLDALRDAAAAHPDWGAWQALVTLPGGTRVNTAGGITHFLGIGWTGGFGEPADGVAEGEVGFASGAALVVRQPLWERLGGFDERYFMYGEDLDLSLRLWLAGHAVGVVPAARVEHDYEFDKGARKWFFLERNRWWTVLSDYPGPLLALVAPALLAAELGLLVVAWRGGWLGQKLRANAAVLRALPAILRRRRSAQALRAVAPADFAAALSAQLDNPFLGPIADFAPLTTLVNAYWTVVRRLLRAWPW
jgi:GT2 family glycosyltransferase